MKSGAGNLLRNRKPTTNKPIMLYYIWSNQRTSTTESCLFFKKKIILFWDKINNFAMNSESLLSFSNFEKFENLIITWNRPIKEVNVFMLNTILCETIFLIVLLIQTNDACDSKLFKYWHIVFWGKCSILKKEICFSKQFILHHYPLELGKVLKKKWISMVLSNWDLHFRHVHRTRNHGDWSSSHRTILI